MWRCHGGKPQLCFTNSGFNPDFMAQVYKGNCWADHNDQAGVQSQRFSCGSNFNDCNMKAQRGLRDNRKTFTLVKGFQFL